MKLLGINFGPAGWKVSPGSSVSGSVPTPITIGLAGVSGNAEFGSFTVVWDPPADVDTGARPDVNAAHRKNKYMLDYIVGGAGLGFSFPVPSIAGFPSSDPSGSIGKVWRVPPYSPPERLPGGISYELGSPTGFVGTTAIIELGGLLGIPPIGLAGSAGLMLMGHIQLPRSLAEAVKRTLLDTAISSFLGPTGFLINFIKNFKYATVVWCTGTGIGSPGAGITILIGSVHNLRKV